MKILMWILMAAAVSFAGGKKDAKKSDPKAEQKAQTAMVFFEEPQDGATVPTKFTVKMGVMGLEVRPAGDKTPRTGHHHLLLDTDSIPEGSAIPMGSPKHLHFGKGEMEAQVELPPGKHTLQLQFADLNHISLGDKLSTTISVNVK